MLRRVLRYADARFGLGPRLDGTCDPRQRRRIPWSVIVRSMMLTVLARVGSLNATDASRHANVRYAWVGCVLPSADWIGEVATMMRPDDLREIIHATYTALKRGKMIEPVQGFLPVVIDGHEVCASYTRCCAACLRRSVNGRTQYYHRVVVAQLVTRRFCLMLDVEMARTGEDEVAAALRLLKRLYRAYPRAWNIVLADSLYARADFFRFVRSHGDHVLTVVKNDRRELLKEMACRCRRMQPVTLTRAGCDCLVWDIADCQGWPDETLTIRVIKSVETRAVTRQRTKRTETVTSSWAWATTCPVGLASLATVLEIAHDRWCIENQGFNDVVNEWHFDHVFKHTQTAMLVFMLLIMLARAVFDAFYHCNMHPALRARLCRHVVACMLHAAFFLPLTASVARSP